MSTDETSLRVCKMAVKTEILKKVWFSIPTEVNMRLKNLEMLLIPIKKPEV
jgi:hypothetical protein